MPLPSAATAGRCRAPTSPAVGRHSGGGAGTDRRGRWAGHRSNRGVPKWSADAGAGGPHTDRCHASKDEGTVAGELCPAAGARPILHHRPAGPSDSWSSAPAQPPPSAAIGPRLAFFLCIALLGSCVGLVPGAQASVAERLVESTRDQLAEWAIPLILAMLPIVELRGAIPVSIIVLQMDPLTVFLLAIIGNMVPVPLLLLGLKPLAGFASERSRFWKRLFDRVFDRARTQTAAWKEHYFAAIAAFVGVPLPGTGAYSGSIACFVLGLPFWKSFFANLTGVTISATIMTAITLAGQWGVKFL